ncbi:uncharacterized protein K452DRAFT_308702 [Aplosporella prunicola CBS 121167]|uniref:Uncharacterized protein n=1 Tax=Aplosporella prunicola CBS 121167 TaxID=1176127 RepID=A0A6A6BBJ9_9PEZI|nr:uncharacterized protein K452DRAFT_308702 [Aplosporella prunicola CBS 121167]KAF2141612.1 hypothetical protein K452DRAFT_308702 [Aplosporella prunicola CBS 121167]
MSLKPSEPNNSSTSRQSPIPDTKDWVKASKELERLRLDDTCRENEVYASAVTSKTEVSRAHKNAGTALKAETVGRLWEGITEEDEHPEGCMCWTVEAQYPSKMRSQI